MKSKYILIGFSLLAGLFSLTGQNSTFSPYSRYGLGELTAPTLAHGTGMGGACIALKPDSLSPIFINAGNPAAYSLIKLTTLEVGGRYQNTTISSGNTRLNKWGTNFSYATLGFPIRNNGGACIGISPYSFVGYETQTIVNQAGIGNVTYKYNGDGGLNKAFLGYGLMPFQNKLTRFRKKHLYVADSLKTLNKWQYRLREFNSKLLSDLSIGFNANYLFGNIENTTRIIYPNSVLYNNTLRERTLSLGNFTGNFGLQTAATIDSVAQGAGAKRALKEKIKIVAGYFLSLNSRFNVTYSSAAYNYILNGAGQEVLRDTAYKDFDKKGKITLPLEQGFGIGFKKGERLNVVADFAVTNWEQYKYLDDLNDFKNNYRVSAGLNYVPEKYAGGRGTFFRRVNYRLGASYNTGYIHLNNTLLSDYSVTAGFGIPVGANRLVASMINISVQYGQLGLSGKNPARENYLRLHFGFTFSERWFQKFRYD